MKIRRRLLLIPLALFLLAMGGALILGWRSQSLLRLRAARVKIGDTQAQVRALLGPPNGSVKSSGGFGSALITGSSWPEWWSYGGKDNSLLGSLNLRHPFTSQFPWFAPLKINISLRPSAGAVVIYFDSSGNVAGISIPEQ